MLMAQPWLKRVVVIGGGLLAVYMIAHTFGRYEIRTSERRVYKVDRWTGKTWRASSRGGPWVQIPRDYFEQDFGR